VLIIGGGIAGLVLAQGLKKNSIPFEIFERDVAPDSRSQGWSFSVHWVLPFLEQVLEADHFSKIGEAAANPNDTGGGGLMLNGVTGEVFPMPQPPISDKITHYRLNRNRFRNFLSTGIHIQWNKQFKNYTLTEKGVTVTFEDGTEAKGDVLIGADGVNSRVCQQLCGGETSTIQLPIEFLIDNPTLNGAQYQKFYERTASHMLIIGPKNGEEGYFNVFFSANDVNVEKDSYNVFWLISWLNKSGSLPLPESNADRILLAKNVAAQMVEPMRSLIMDTPNDNILQTLNVREREPIQWNSHGKVTLIGDAAHAMSMFRGEGGNHAMQDSAELTTELVSAHQGTKSLGQALSDYVEKMIPRGTAAVQGSHQAAFDMHTNPEETLLKFRARFPVVKT